MKIDTITMLIALTILCLGFSTTMLLVWRFLLPMRALLLWGCGMGCYGLGVLLIALRDRIPDILSLPVGNLLLLCCYSLIWIGISVYRSKAPWFRTILLILLLFIPCYSWFVWGSPNIALRTALVRVFMLVLLGGILATMVNRHSGRVYFMEKVVVGAFCLDIVFRFGLIMIQLVNLTHLEPLQKNMVTAVSSIFSMVTMVIWGMAVVLLALESATNDLQSALTDREEQNRQNQLNQQRLQALLDISQFAAEDTQQLLNYSLEKVMQITASQFGYIYHYHEDSQEFVLNSWSNGVMPSCSVANPQTLYHLEKTGIWGEAVRQRRSILINDFAADNPLKKGYPEGHVHLSRFLTVPVFDHTQQIVAVVGVANKELPYTEQDIQQLELMLTEVWRTVKRIELEAKLIHAGREWQITFDAISDSVSLIDREMRILRCNKACKQLFNREFKDIIGHYCWEVIHNADGPIEDCPMLRSLQTRKTESQLVFQGNRWLHLTVDPLLDEQREVIGVVLIIHDDTERVEADQSQRELLAMLEAVQNELYVFNPDTLLFEYVNQSAQNNLGYSLAQLQTMTPLDLKQMTRRQFMPMIASLTTGELPLLRFEATHRRSDGSCYPVEVNLQMVSTHTGNRYLAVIHDISGEKQMEEQLFQSLELFRLFMLYSPVYIYIKEVLADTSVVLQASENFIDLVGMPGSQIIGKRMEEIFPAAFAAKIIQEDLEVVSKGVAFECDEEFNGRNYFTIKFPIKFGSKQLLAGYTLDISERKQAENALKEMQSQLLQNDKMASIGQLSAGIAHEINNPMGFINSNLGTLEKYVDKFDRYISALEPLVQNCCTEQQQQSAQALRKELKLDYVLRDIRQLLEESADGAGRVMRIVQDLKTFSRSDTAQIARAELHSCIDSTINIIWNQIKYVAELKKEYGDLPKIPCNIQQINQVFMNLLVNACHAIQEKQSDELGTITVRTWADNDNAYIAIADTGCGIPDDVRRRIFEPFYTTKDVGKGTGLGLSISHEIIKKHGGELTVVSEVGTGTTFTIRLPLNQPVAHSTSASAGSQ